MISVLYMRRKVLESVVLKKNKYNLLQLRTLGVLTKNM